MTKGSMRYKILAAALCAAMAGTVTAGCGTSSSAESAETVAESASIVWDETEGSGTEDDESSDEGSRDVPEDSGDEASGGQGGMGGMTPWGSTDGTSSSSEGTSEVITSAELTDYIKDSDYDTDWSEDVTAEITGSGSSCTVDGSGAVYADGCLTISEEGTYVLSGDYDDIKIKVEAGEEDHVHLVFNGLTMTESDGAVLTVSEADKVVITLADGTVNTLTDGKTYSDENEKGAIDCHADLVFNGTGTLVMTANGGDAVKSHDDLRIISGTFEITAEDEAFVSDAALVVADGSFTLSSEGGKGFKADEVLVFFGGQVDITKSVEGMESPNIVIAGGDLNIVSSDDGINAAGGNADTSDAEGHGFMETSTGYLTITGGTIYVNAQGDGLDANTSIAQSGGTVIVDGPSSDGNGAIDYASSYNMTGGSLLAVGSSGMLQSISSESTEKAIVWTGTGSAGDKITIQDASGKTLAEYTAKKAFGSVVYADESLAEDVTYTITVGDKTEEITVSDGTYATGMGGGMGGHGMHDGPGRQADNN